MKMAQWARTGGSRRTWEVMAKEGMVWEECSQGQQWGAEVVHRDGWGRGDGVEADGAVMGGAGQHGEMGQCRPR